MVWKQQLQELGYCVIPCLSADEVELGLALFETWRIVNRIPVAPHGVISHYRVGHTAFAWWCRTRPKIRGVFEELWNTSELVVSFDGACYFPENLKRRNTNWWHVDQAPRDKGFKCVQGFVAFTDNEEATLMVVPGSHLEFGTRFEGNNSPKRWYKVPGHHEGVRVKVNAGDLVLWDSRLIHQNSYGPEKRLVQYLSYLPRSGLISTQASKRVKYFQEKRTTSHWAYPVSVNSLQPQVFGDNSKLIRYSDLVETGQDLLEDLANSIKELV